MNTPTHLLTSSATVGVQTTSTSDGTEKPSWPVASPTIACNIQPLSSDDRLQYDRETALRMYTVLCAPTDSAGTDTLSRLNGKNRLVIGGVTYAQSGPGQDIAGKGVLYRVLVERVEGVIS